MLREDSVHPTEDGNLLSLLPSVYSSVTAALCSVAFQLNRMLHAQPVSSHPYSQMTTYCKHLHLSQVAQVPLEGTGRACAQGKHKCQT